MHLPPIADMGVDEHAIRVSCRISISRDELGWLSYEVTHVQP